MTASTAQSSSRGIILAIATAIILGAYPPAMRGVYSSGGNVMFVIVSVAWTRALALTGYCLVTNKHLFQRRNDVRQGIAGGVFQFLTSIGISASLVYLPGPIMSIIVYTYAIMLLFFTAYRGEIKLNAVTIGATFMAFIGLTLVLDIWHNSIAINWIGVGWACLAAIASACRIYIFGKHTGQRDPIVVGAESYIFTTLFVSMAMFYRLPQMPVAMWGYMWACIACVTIALASFTMFYGISLLGAFRWGLFSKIEPIFTSLFSIWFLGEVLKWQQYVGILVVVGSLVAYQSFDQRQQKLAANN